MGRASEHGEEAAVGEWLLVERDRHGRSRVNIHWGILKAVTLGPSVREGEACGGRRAIGCCDESRGAEGVVALPRCRGEEVL